MEQELLRNLRDGSSDKRLLALKELDDHVDELRATPTTTYPGRLEEIMTLLLNILCENIPAKPPRNHTPLLAQLFRTLHHLIHSTTTTNQPPLPQDAQVKYILTNNNIFLSRLSTWSLETDPPLPNESYDSYLQLLDLLSANILLPFKPSFINNLIRNAKHIILHSTPHSKPFATGLAILTHLAESSPVAIRAIQGAEGFKKLWETLYSLFKTNYVDIKANEHPTSPILLARLVLLVDFNSSPTLLQYAFHHATTLSSTVLDPNPRINELHLIDEFATLLEGITKKLQTTVGPDPAYILEAASQVQGVQRDSTLPQDCASFIESYIKMATTTLNGIDSSGNKSIPILRLVSSLISEYKISELIVPTTYETIFSIIHRIERDSAIARTNKSLGDVYSAYHRLFSILSNMPHIFAKQTVSDLFVKVIKNLQLTPGSSPEIIAQNTSCCRLLALSQKSVLLRDQVVGKLQSQADNCQKLLDDLLGSEASLETAWCVVEVLGLLADNSRNKAISDLLLSGLNSGGACRHLAAAIHSTHAPLVTRALNITATVSFSRDNLKELSDALVKINCGEYLPFKSEPQPLVLSSAATLGLSAIESTLESVAATNSSFNRSAAATLDDSPNHDLGSLDVVTMYENRLELVQMQMTTLTEQLSQANDMNRKLTQLLGKNGQIMGMQLAEVQLKEVHARSLKTQVDDLTQSVSKLEREAVEATKNIQQKLFFNKERIAEAEKKIEGLEKQLVLLEKEKKNLSKKVENEAGARKKQIAELGEVKKELTKKEELLQEMQKRVSKLERELTNAGEEQKRLEHLLAKEKQTVDVIRGLLNNGPHA